MVALQAPKPQHPHAYDTTTDYGAATLPHTHNPPSQLLPLTQNIRRPQTLYQGWTRDWSGYLEVNNLGRYFQDNKSHQP